MGGGTWWAKCNKPIVEGSTISTIDLSPNLILGFYFKHYYKSKFTLETGFNYQLLFSNYSYKSFYPNPDEYILVWNDPNSPLRPLNVREENFYTSNPFGEEESTINYHCIEIPMQIGYVFNKINPYIGLKNSYKLFSLTEWKVVADNGNNIGEWKSSKKGINNSQICFGLTVGINYIITDKLFLKLNYYHAYTNDYNVKAFLVSGETDKYGTHEKFPINYLNWKTRSIDMTLSYSLKNRKNDNIE